MSKSLNAFRGSILHFPETTSQPDNHFSYFSDGLLVTRNEKIIAVGEYKELWPSFHDEVTEIVDYSGKLILPGLIDSHMHFPQTEMIASYGEQLLEWLQQYTFPTEYKFADAEYADKIAKIFLNQLVSNGTTTAMVFSSVHAAATDVLFSAAADLNMKLIIGKTCMDRNCPSSLQDTAESAQRDSADLIHKWHNRARSHYALTPRFAPTSSPEQLAALGELAQQFPDVFVQTHLSENKHEIDWVKQLYPAFDHYLDVYDHYHLVHKRSVFGHCLHLDEHEWQLLHDKQANVAFCPSSNLFLGSGLFGLNQADEHQVNVLLASDVGAGTSFNMFRIMGEAYKVCQLNTHKLSPLRGLYMMTQGSASSLDLAHQVGNLNTDTDADFIVVDPCFNQLSHLRNHGHLNANSLPQDCLFALSMLADERAIFATYIAGKRITFNEK